MEFLLCANRQEHQIELRVEDIVDLVTSNSRTSSRLSISGSSNWALVPRIAVSSIPDKL